MKENQIYGLAMLFTGLGLLLFFSIETALLDLGRYNDFAQGLGIGTSIPALCVWIYAYFFLRDAV